MPRTLTPAAILLVILAAAAATGPAASAPYPPSGLIAGMTWVQGTYSSGGPGGDLWPPTSGADGSVYAAWGDGALGCGRKVSYGIAALPPVPRAQPRTVACGPAGSAHGKIISLLDVRGTLYAVFLVRENSWPGSPVDIRSSGDHGRSWRRPGWSFAGGDLRPQSFVNFGPGYAGARDGYVYLAAVRGMGRPDRFFLLRAPVGSLGLHGAYQCLAGADGAARRSGAAAPSRRRRSSSTAAAWTARRSSTTLASAATCSPSPTAA